MKSMLAVTQLISRQKLRKIDVFTEDVLNAKQSKFKELYEGLRDGTIRSDREAALKLYNSDPSDTRYRQLKSRFRKRLLNTLFFVDQSRPHRSSFEQTYHNCQRDWSLINILRVNGAEDSAIQMAKSLFTISQNYGFAELTIQSGSYLANDAATNGKLKGALAIEEIVEKATYSYQIELRSEAILRRARLLFNMPISDSARLESDEKRNQIQRDSDANALLSDSAMVFYNHTETSCILARLSNRSLEVISLVDGVISYSEESHRQMQEKRIWEMSMWQIEAYIQTKNKVRGLVALARIEARHKTGSTEWFEIQRARIALLLAVKEVEESTVVLKKITAHRNFKRLPAQEIEAFKLLEILTICSDTLFTATGKNTNRASIESFLRKDATFGGELQRLNAWRYLLKATLQHRTGDQKGLSDSIADLRNLSVKRLDAKRDARMIAMSQLLYRLERKNFSGILDRVGERYFHQVQSLGFRCALHPESFSPYNVEDLLTFFGINELVGLPA